MAKEFWTVTEIVERLEIKRDFLNELEQEEIICPVCRGSSPEKLINSDDLEKLRLAMVLYEDMEVNLAGIEVILHMRQNMLEMRAQFDAILEDLARRLQARLGEDF